MGMTDNLKARANAGMERATNAWGALRGSPAQPAGAAPAAPSVDYSAYDQPTYQRQGAQFGQGKAFEFDANKFHMERGTGALRPNAPINPAQPMTPPQNMAGTYGSGGQPPAQTSKMGIAGKALAGAGSVLYGADAVNSAVKGDVGNAVGSAGMAAAPFAGPVGLGAMAVDGVSRATTGKSLTDWIGTAVAKAFGPAERPSTLTPEFQKVVDAAGGPEAYAAGKRAPAAAAAPAAAPVAATQLPTVQGFDAGTPEARGIRAQIADPKFTPAEGTGMFTNNSTGRAYRINAPAPTAPAEAKAPMSPRDAVIATLRNEMNTAINGRARRDAAGRLADFLDKEDKNALTRDTATRENAKFKAELGDKRMKDFNEQHVNNQFYTKDKDGKDVPDTVKNARLLDFMRQADPRFATESGMAEISQLSPQDRNKLVGELRRSFLEKEQVEEASNKGALFRKPGYSNQPVTLRGPAREATVGDIPDIGIGNYLWSNLPFTNRDVVDTDRGAVTAEDYIGDGEDSRTRRSKLYPGQK